MSERLIDVGLEAMVATSRPSSGWMVGAALVSAVGALAAAGRKLVVMNRWRMANTTVPQPTEPVDDFSIALWEYAKRALDESGLEVAQLHYWGGVPTNGQEHIPSGEQTIASIQFYRDADRYEAAETPLAGGHAAKVYWVTRDGDLKKSIDRRPSNRVYDAATKTWVDKKPSYEVVGNICKWKFKKEAFRAPPPPAPPRAPPPEITTTTRVGRRRR